MDLYSLLREFADSWWLIAMMAFFIGVSAYAFRPGSSRLHASIADIPLRNDDELPPEMPKPCTGNCKNCPMEGRSNGN